MINVPENIEKILEKFVNGTAEILGNHLKKIILYGSYARGDYNEHSDIDIMVLTDLKDKELSEIESKIWNLAYDIEWDNDFTVDLSPKIRNIESFNYWLEAMPFYMNVQKEGVVLSEPKNIERVS